MTLAAVLAEPGSVRVVLLVTIETDMLADLVSTLGMAGAAGSDSVLALEAEPRMRKVLGLDRVEAQEWRVALEAVLPELALVLVLVTIDAGALAGAIVTAGVATLTLGASLQGLVKPDQRKTRVLVVVERPAALSALDVAARTRLVGELTLMGIAMRVAARASALAIDELDTRFVAASTPELGVVPEERKTHSLVIEGRAPPRPSGLVALGAIPGDRSDRVDGRVAVPAGPLSASGDRYGFAAPQVTAPAAHGSVLSHQPQAVLGMVDRGPPEGALLRMTPEAIGGLCRHRMRRSMTIGTGPRSGAATHDGLLVALGARLLGVFPFQDQPGVLRVRGLPFSERPAAERLARLMTGIALLG
jgi:hypothetical protein